MPIHLSPTATAALASGSLTRPNASNSSVIPENETFRQAFKDASDTADTPEKVSGVAKQFEALMIGQMLKSARESSGGGWLGNEDDKDDQTGSMVMELAEQGFSQAMAARGGFGIAKMVTANLERHQPKTASSDAEGPQPPSTNTGLKR
jgi:Rod binding domain-containing protein